MADQSISWGADRERRFLRISARSPVRHLDLSLMVVAAGLSVFGALAIYSSTRPRLDAAGLDQHYFIKRQLIFIAIATISFLISLIFDYRQLRALAPILYGLGLLALVVVLSPLGHSAAGAQRWINFGVLRVQPSELSKIVLVVALAALFADERGTAGLRKLAAAVGMAGLLAVFVYKQPDLGTVMVLFAIVFVVLLVSGIRARWLLLVLLAGAVSFVLIFQLGLLKDYQVARLTGFLDPHSDTRQAGYNLAQSKIAIGSGGLGGKGLFTDKGTQTNLDYVPEQHTDFIFTAIAEGTGFFGSTVLLALFALLLWRALRIAMLSKDFFGTLLAAGIAGLFAFQMFVNVGMTLGIMPITGIPLPFVSYGGSSLITSNVAVGLLMNIHMRRFT
jgi:rod shape determining protein RodA